MSQITNAKAASKLPAPGRWAFVLGLLALAVGCGDPSAPVAPPFTGTGGSGSSSGTGGMSGTGGVSGTGSTSGTGGTVGTGGTGGSLGPCATNALCHTCPDDFLCDTDEDCAFSGNVCIPSGCETLEGAPIKQCQPSRGGSCASVAECPNATDYKCIPVGAGSPHCVRVTPGCTGPTESYDCVPGFSCEGGTCVDRRVPCDDYVDCPKNHVCSTTPTASFCVSVFRTCHEDEDCAGFGRFCADVDNDGTTECAGELGGSGDPCLNSDCSTSPAPVCEAGRSGTTAVCGDYGLCRTDNDCDINFECVGLWQDGRKECVPTGGTCDEVTDCDPQQVCAAPRNGGSPRCQTGNVL
jgi:hypothetical protein